jgi:undecaprenyl-diphosphatase
MTNSLTYAEAIVVGALQGVTELFPVSSLGHSILLPALIGGRWADDLNVSTPESPYLAFIVGLHVATALALLVFFWRDWVRIIGGFVSSVRHRRMETPDERLAWMIIIGTIPVGIMGLLLEHLFRTVLGRPTPAAVFLILNGFILFAAQRLQNRAPVAVPVLAGETPHRTQAASELAGGSDLAAELNFESDAAADRRIARRTIRETTLIATAQVSALLPGISRSGATMAAGLGRGLSSTDAARFSFLLATPVILAAGVLKLPDLFGPLGAGIHGQVLVGSLASGIAAYLAVRFLMRYFQTRTLTPFAIYCVAAGLGSLLWLTVRG